MTEFTNLLQVTAIGTDPQQFSFLADTFEFQPVPTTDESGPSWTCDKTFVIDTPDNEALAYFRIPRNAILTIKASDRQTYTIGTEEVPARIMLARHLQRTQLIMTCTMLKNPLA